MEKRHLILVILAMVSYGMYVLYQPFLMDMVVAILLVISTHHIQVAFIHWTRSRFWASVLSTTVLGLLFFFPLGYFLLHFSSVVRTITPDVIERSKFYIGVWSHYLPDPILWYLPKLDTLIKSFSANVFAQLFHYTSLVGAFMMSFLSNAFLILVFYFMSHYHGRAIFNFFRQSVHFPQQESTLIIFEMRSSMSVVFYSILATAILEGILFGIGVEYIGYNGLLFGIMYGFASLIPFVGGILMWVPFGMLELSRGNLENAIFIVGYSIIVISILADTVIKPMIIRLISQKLIKPTEKINELVIFFAIIAGLSTFGFWGMIIGPALTVLFITLLRINQELQGMILRH